jgi:hypothetical protein
VTYLICDTGLTTVRVFKAGGSALGFFSHLLLDEIWSIEVSKYGTPRLKSSSGTAMKFFGHDPLANSMCYGLLLLIGLAAMQDTAVARAELERAYAQKMQSAQPKPPTPLSRPQVLAPTARTALPIDNQPPVENRPSASPRPRALPEDPEWLEPEPTPRPQPRWPSAAGDPPRKIYQARGRRETAAPPEFEGSPR